MHGKPKLEKSRINVLIQPEEKKAAALQDVNPYNVEKKS